MFFFFCKWVLRFLDIFYTSSLSRFLRILDFLKIISSGIGFVAKWVKLPCVMLAFPKCAGLCWSCSTSDPAPDNGLRRAIKDSLIIWVSATYVGDSDKTLGF